ncbi:MAG: hypothetical protein KKA84_13285 [Bacteroidetes bacterium]|nr:hypothetical protein [Bacteroidota bacterium]
MLIQRSNILNAKQLVLMLFLILNMIPSNYYCQSRTLLFQTNKVSIVGNKDQLKEFSKALDNSKNQVVRIAHYGDSSLLGDVISEALRYEFQTRFGGQGAGFMSLCSSDVTMRKSSIQQFSDDWKYTSIFLRNPDQLPLGISGYVASPQEGSTLKFNTTHHIKNLYDYYHADVYYSHAQDNSTIDVIIDDGDRKSINLIPGKELNKSVLLDSKTKSLDLTFKNCSNAYFYGISFENGNGVYLDNFPVTGNTGVSLLDISSNMLTAFKKYIDYNLIILHYGMNLPTPKGGTLKIYKDKMLKVIKHYQDTFPNAGILMVGISDRIMKKGNKIITSRETYEILEAQKDIAKEAKVAYWSLFDAMGGKDSMGKWVDSAPPMALKDYRHFTHEGGEIVAKLFFDAIMEATGR